MVKANVSIEERKLQTNKLLAEYQSAPDYVRRQIEEKIFQLNKPLVHKTLKMFGIPSQKYNDFLQEASRGMIEAIRRFDVNAAAFSTFAVTTMKGVIRNGFRDNEWTLNVPRTEKERGVRISKMAHDPEKLKALNETEEEVNNILSLINAQHPAELTNEYILNLPSDFQAEEDLDVLEAEEESFQILSLCNKEDATLLKMHFIEGYSIEEIAVALIMNKIHVEQSIDRILKYCKEKLLEETNDGTGSERVYPSLSVE